MHFRIAVVFFFILVQSSAQNNTADIEFQNKAVTLCRFFSKNHYQPVQWNDTTSALLHAKWLNELDEEKQFFTQSDIAILDAYKNNLDDELKGKSWGFYNKSVSIFLQRVSQIDSLLKVFLSKPIDISRPENIEHPFKNYAASTVSLNQRWQQFAKWRILKGIVQELEDDSLGNVNAANIPADFSALEADERKYFLKQNSKRFNRIKDFGPKFQDYYLNTIAWCYDPHSNYMNINVKNEFETQLSGFEFSSGMEVRQNEKEEVEVSKLSPGGAAWRSGNLFAGDVIIKVKKGNDPEKRIADMSAFEINNILEGSSNEKVELVVRAKNGTEKRVLLPKEKIVDDEEIVKSYLLQGRKKIGYIQLPGFYSGEFDYKKNEDARHDGCANDVSKEIIKLKKDSIAGLILDLRDNGGGNMWEAMQLAGIFIDIGVVGSVKDKNQKVFFLKDPNRGTIYDGPLLILVNGASASASEFTSAVLQDYHRAVIVGSTTYGKGTAQIILPLDTALDFTKPFDEKKYTDFVKITDEKFYRVDGSTTQWTGVVPDIALPQINAVDDSEEEGAGGEKVNPTALLPDKSKAAFYMPYTNLPLKILEARSAERIRKDSSFIILQKLNGVIKERQNKVYTIPLQWSSYVSMHKKEVADYSFVLEDNFKPVNKLTVKNNSFDVEKYRFISEDGREIVNENLEDIADDFYIYEAMQIIQDWIENEK